MTALSVQISACAEDVSRKMEAHLPREGDVAKAMRESVLAGGKRLRPFLLIEATELSGGARDHALHTAMALEYVHAYSLIHDDLPCMDDASLRHGKPALHKVFGEGLAVLAGDALLSLAFEVLSEVETHPDADVRIALVGALAEASGVAGMVGGQGLDIKGVGGRDMQARKTGALMRFACAAGAMLGGASDEARASLSAFGEAFGVAYQIVDDALDARSSDETGKAAKQKPEAALPVSAARDEMAGALLHLDMFGARADGLRGLAQFALERRK